MLYCGAQPTLPGGHAKWVRIPHGPATVSGERNGLPAPGPPIGRPGSPGPCGRRCRTWSRHCARVSMGRRGRFVSIRESGYLATGLVLFRSLGPPCSSGFGAWSRRKEPDASIPALPIALLPARRVRRDAMGVRHGRSRHRTPWRRDRSRWARGPARVRAALPPDRDRCDDVHGRAGTVHVRRSRRRTLRDPRRADRVSSRSDRRGSRVGHRSRRHRRAASRRRHGIRRRLGVAGRATALAHARQCDGHRRRRSAGASGRNSV